MKILVDIGHPAHVHYFRNFYQIMKGKGHKFLFIARRREVIEDLLKYYKIDYISRGEGKDSAFGKLFYMLYADFLILKHALIFKPDIFISFSSPYAAQVATFLNKPHIAINDTEHTDKVHSKFTYPFSKSIITPKSYQNDLGFKHVRIDNIIESFYLHPKYFKKDPSIFEFLKIDSNTPYVILRFVETLLDKTVWDDNSAEEIWPSFISVSNNIQKLALTGIIDHLDDLDDLLWSLTHCFCRYFTSFGISVPTAIYNKIELDLKNSEISFLEEPEQDDGIKTKKEHILEALMKAKFKAYAYEKKGIISQSGW
ncbi:MAG: hypothetical protein US22_C0015G0006 [candidate division TM6 bacterium GW2011_GWF2_36_6]|nr:MAG: hypothetical protein US22_C0015G0006 [candidate division TM6 bacterium GW2011_GWF2_36_6]